MLLFAIEAKSHQQWLEGDLAALTELMAEEFHFVVMNGAVETKADVVAMPYSGKGALRVTSLRSSGADRLGAYRPFHHPDSVAAGITV